MGGFLGFCILPCLFDFRKTAKYRQGCFDQRLNEKALFKPSFTKDKKMSIV